MTDFQGVQPAPALKHKCPARVGEAWHRIACGRNATHEHNGTMFCKTHHPPTITAKRDAKHAAWQIEWDRKREVQKAADAVRAEQKRRADLFPELLEALRFMVENIGQPVAIETRDGFAAARAAIAKATGEPA